MPSSDGARAARGQRAARARSAAVRVLRDLDLAVAAGEALAVAGPNGAGKTTLLRLLAGLCGPTAGEVQVLGRPLAGEPPTPGAPIGLLSHQSLLYDDLTLLENLAFAARLYGLARPGGGGTRGARGGGPRRARGRLARGG